MFKFLTKFLDLNQKEVDGLKTKVARVNSFTDNYKKLKKAEDEILRLAVAVAGNLEMKPVVINAEGVMLAVLKLRLINKYFLK